MGAFVGRKAELERLERGLAAARAGDGELLLVDGDPGIGKSALAAEATRLARAAGMRSCWGGCLESGGAAPYRPWTQILTGLAVPTDLLTEGADGAASRFRVFDDVVEQLRSAATPYGLLVVLDDLHGADVPSLRLLHVLASAVADSQMFVLGLYRRAEAYPRLAEVLAAVRRERATSSLPLGGLARGEVAELARRTLGEMPEPALLAAVERRAEGNPLFAVELVRYAAAARTAELPESVREIIADRLGQLPPESRRCCARPPYWGGSSPPANWRRSSRCPCTALRS